MSDFTSLWLQDEGGVSLYAHYNNSETISRTEQALGLAFDAPPFFGHARATKNCPSLQRVALRGLTQLGVNLWQWPVQDRRSSACLKGGPIP